MVTSRRPEEAVCQASLALEDLAESAAAEVRAGHPQADFSRPRHHSLLQPDPARERDTPDLSAHFFLTPLPVVGEGWGEGASLRFPCVL